MYKAQNNLGIYYELSMLLDYIEDDEDLELLDLLLKDFTGPGLAHYGIKLAIELIETYLPDHIECDCDGCYFTQEVEGMAANTYFSDIKTDEPVALENKILAKVWGESLMLTNIVLL